MKSSKKPINPYDKNTNNTITKFTENSIFPVSNKNKVIANVGIINIKPPIVGVPALFLCASTYIFIFCPAFNFFRNGKCGRAGGYEQARAY